MATRYWNIINSQVTLMSTSELERVLVFSWNNYVNNSWSILLLVQTLKHQVITFWALIVNQIVCTVAISSSRALCAKNERIGLFANLALEWFPVERLEASTVFHLLFNIEPASQALKMNVSDRSWAFANWEKGVKISSSCVPTEPASWDLFIVHIIRVKTLFLMVSNRVKDALNLLILF